MSEEIGDWYDKFAAKQLKTSVNLRHYKIFNKVKSLGLKRDSTVLEIGCGIGTLTGLLFRYTSKGTVLAVDISEESLKIARQRLGPSNRINFLLSDMTNFTSSIKFDFIVLPDVLEHIPIENHDSLFKTLAQYLNLNGQIIIHVPHPKAIEFYRTHQPEKLQIIDQAIYPEMLTGIFSKHKLLMTEYKAYNLFHKNLDYVFIVLRKNSEIILTNQDKNVIRFNKLKERLKYFYALFT